MKNVIILIFTMSLLLVNLNAQDKNTRVTKKEIPTYQIGDKVQDFSLPNTNGVMTSLSDYKDAKGYIVVFTSNVCPFALASEDRLTQLHNELAPKGYPVIAINSNEGDAENVKAMKAKSADKKFSFDYLKDNASVYAKFGATKTPHVFLLDNTMTVQYMGSIDDNPRSPEDVEENYLVDAVNDIMNNRTPDPAITKSIGCPIKRGDHASGKRRKGPPSPEVLLERMDKNKDNKISRSEAEGPLAADFNSLDTDKDGVLTVSELSKAKPRKRKAH